MNAGDLNLDETVTVPVIDVTLPAGAAADVVTDVPSPGHAPLRVASDETVVAFTEQMLGVRLFPWQARALRATFAVAPRRFGRSARRGMRS